MWSKGIMNVVQRNYECGPKELRMWSKGITNVVQRNYECGPKELQMWSKGITNVVQRNYECGPKELRMEKTENVIVRGKNIFCLIRLSTDNLENSVRNSCPVT
jgi:hypothetical protein